ncbi:MAG: hypothetical protein JWM89_1252 [Acidimicrobiales bacterium]|nr:hypothetical protein [Acidimicrobiales bacterium]
MCERRWTSAPPQPGGHIRTRSLTGVSSRSGSPLVVASSLSVSHRAATFGAFAVTVGLGLASAAPRSPTLVVGGALLALGAGAALFLFAAIDRIVLVLPTAAGIVEVAHGDSSSLAWFGLCILGGWTAFTGGRTLGFAAWIAGVLLLAAEDIFTVQDPGWAAWSAGLALTILASLLLRHQIELVEQMRRLQADLAQRSRAEERNRIAQDIHDVIAHSLTVSLLHVSSARLAMEHDPDDAVRALSDAERLTRQSLMDVRATVGLLSSGDGAMASPPQPTLGELPKLIEELRAAQADVSLHLDGDLDELAATTASTAYRIVQEALTNAARHAPGSPVRVRVVGEREAIDVSVWSAGTPGRGAGMGLRNMEERAEAVGGHLAAGPFADGWRVHASLPRVSVPGIGAE